MARSVLPAAWGHSNAYHTPPPINWRGVYIYHRLSLFPFLHQPSAPRTPGSSHPNARIRHCNEEIQINSPTSRSYKFKQPTQAISWTWPSWVGNIYSLVCVRVVWSGLGCHHTSRVTSMSSTWFSSQRKFYCTSSAYLQLPALKVIDLWCTNEGSSCLV